MHFIKLLNNHNNNTFSNTVSNNIVKYNIIQSTVYHVQLIMIYLHLFM